MKLKALTSILAIVLIICSSATAQVNNRLPRKAIIGAMQNALQDSTNSTIKPFVCKPNTVSITVEVTNTSVPTERPYTITADSLGITLEIFRGDEHVFNEFFQYRGSNFTRIMAKVKAAKLKKVKAHGESLDGGNSTILSFNNKNGAYFRLSDKSGIMDYEGDFDGVITEITRQIPNFQAIICKNYDDQTPVITKDEIKVNEQICDLIPPVEVSGILSFEETADNNEVSLTIDNPEIIVSFLEGKHNFKLIKMRKFKNKKRKKEFYGISFEDVVKEAVSPESESTKDGVKTSKYRISTASGSHYVLYDSITNKAIPLKISTERVVG